MVNDPRKIPQDAWRTEIQFAFDALSLAETYADDGAFLSAARNAELAARRFRKGHELRAALIEQAVRS
jgi:hypothetical protein